MSDDGTTDEGSGEASDGEVERHEELEQYEERIRAEGHEHVQGTHASTFEVTTDDYLTAAGDCIVGIEADRAPADFDDAFVAACQHAEARIVTTLTVRGGGDASEGADGSEGEAGGGSATGGEAVENGVTGAVVGRQDIVARGDPALAFESERSAVWRTSDYVDERTVAVGADAAAVGIDRELVEALADGAALDVRISVEPPT